MNEIFTLICMDEEYWGNSQLSVARYYGGIIINSIKYKIVNKHGITLGELSDIGSKHYVNEGKAIPPGEPADLIQASFIKYYKKLGRDRFLDILKKNQRKSKKEIEDIYKELIKVGR
jgi:hypothetical protein